MFEKGHDAARIWGVADIYTCCIVGEFHREATSRGVLFLARGFVFGRGGDSAGCCWFFFVLFRFSRFEMGQREREKPGWK